MAGHRAHGASMVLRWMATRALALAVGTGLALGVSEWAMRRFDVEVRSHDPLSQFHVPHERYGWIGAPHHVGRFRGPGFDVPISMNELGFRKPLHPPPSERRAPTLAFLGDSFTWGWGVPDGELFTDHLQESLGDRAQVLNFGITGWSTGQQLLVFRDQIAPIVPEVLTLCVFQNDVKENGDPSGGRRPWFRCAEGQLHLERRSVPRANAPAPRMRSLEALHAVGNRVGKALRRLRDGVVLAGEPERPVPGTEAEWELAETLLRTLRDECDGLGIRLQVFVVTGGWEVGCNGSENALVDQVFGVWIRTPLDRSDQ